jgi:hypothetical protein
MNKQTKMLLGVGALAAAGYLIWKKSKMKPAATASFVNASGSLVVTKNGRIVGRSASTPKGSCKCSPNGNVAGQLGGKDVYECCGNGMYAYKAGTILPGCAGECPSVGTTGSTLGQPNFSGTFEPTKKETIFV